MEPLAANSGLSTLVRPTIALQGDLPAMLKEGRVLSGEVMQKMDGGTLLLAIGEHKVPADAQVDLQPGQKFRAQVVLKDGKLALQVLPGTDRVSEPALLRALRSLIGAELPVADLLGELLGGLPKDGASRARTRLDVMLQQIATAAPAADAVEHLAAELRGALVTSAKHAGVAVPSTEAFFAFKQDLTASIERAASSLGRRPVQASLTTLAFGELAQRFGLELVAALRSRPQSAVRDFLMQGLERVGGAALVQNREAALLTMLHQAGVLAPGERGASEGSTSEALFSKLQQTVFQPGSSGEQLQKAVHPGGFGYEHALMAAASVSGVDNVESALKNLANEIRARLSQAPPEARPAPGLLFERPLGEAIDRGLKALSLLRADGPLTRTGFQKLAHAFEREVTRALRAQPSSRERDAAVKAVESLPKGELVRGRESALIRAMLAGDSKLASSLSRAATAGMAGDTRGQLLEAMLGEGLGTAREPVSKALGGLELQNILNMARQDMGEAMHWSFPIPDGAGWTTAHLFTDPHGESGANAESEAAETTYRLVVGVDFTALGPIRADVLLAPGALTVRLLVSDANLAQRIRRDAGELSEYLAFGGRRVQVAVALGTDGELDVDAMARDIRFLRENHLMDVEG